MILLKREIREMIKRSDWLLGLSDTTLSSLQTTLTGNLGDFRLKKNIQVVDNVVSSTTNHALAVGQETDFMRPNWQFMQIMLLLKTEIL